MDTNKKAEKTIVWLSATLIMISILAISVLCLFFYEMDSAWLFLSFTGTSLTLVLSVIAIVITLVDVAGQKHQVAEIAESAKKLKTILEEQKVENKNLKEEMLNRLNSEDINDLTDMKKSLKEIYDFIQNGEDGNAINVISQLTTNLEQSLIKRKSLERNEKNMITKTFNVRKNISNEEITKFKNFLNSCDYGIQEINIEKNDQETYNCMIVTLEDKLTANDLVVHVMAEFKPEG